MEFKIEEKKPKNIEKYKTEEFQLAKRFAEEIKKELGDFVKCVILFGSAARYLTKAEAGLTFGAPAADIDVMIVIDDLTPILSPEVIETYRVIVENTASKITKRLHITTMKLSNFWDLARNGDPILINIFRDGVALADVGIFAPLQALLFSGRIKPSKESVYNYLARSPLTIVNANWHVLQATLDLYWAVVDATHAVLMHFGELPPMPENLAKSLSKLVEKKLLSKKHVETMDFFYKLAKRITHREIQKIKGEEYDKYKAMAEEFIKDIKEVILKKL